MMTMIIYCKNHNPQRKSTKKLNFEKTQNKKKTHAIFVSYLVRRCMNYRLVDNDDGRPDIYPFLITKSGVQDKNKKEKEKKETRETQKRKKKKKKKRKMKKHKRKKRKRKRR